MKHLIRVLLAIVALFMSQGLIAEEDHEPERAALRSMLAQIEAALNEPDMDKLIPLLDDNVVVVYLNGEVARGVDQVRAYFDKTLGSSNAILKAYSVKAEVGAPARFVGDLVMADGTSLDHFTFVDGTDFTVQSFWTVTLQQHDTDDWKVLQLHFSSNLFQNPLVGAMKNKILWVSGIAAVIGLVVGLILGRKRFRNA